MEIGSFLFMAKKQNSIIYLIVSFILLLTSCQTLKRNVPQDQDKKHIPQVVVPQQPSTPQPPVNTDSAPQSPQVVTPQIVTPQAKPITKGVPRFGIIFSAGGAKTWAHIGVLKEMEKFRFPIVSVAGVEWGSVIAASYAHNLSVNEVEWELSKFKDIDDWDDFIKTAFNKTNTTTFKASFVCPSLNLKNKTSYLLNRGQIDQFLPYCVPSAGLLKPYANSVANMTDVSQLVQHLKATGVSKIILINVLTSKTDKSFVKSWDSVENQIWTQFAASLAKKIPLVDEVIEIDLSDYAIDDFNKRRDIISKGSELGYNQVKKIADKYKL